MGKLLIMSSFSISHSVFYPFEELSAIFINLLAANFFSLEESKICHLGKNCEPNIKEINLTKIKVFADTNIRVVPKMIYDLEMAENIARQRVQRLKKNLPQKGHETMGLFSTG